MDQLEEAQKKILNYEINSVKLKAMLSKEIINSAELEQKVRKKQNLYRGKSYDT